MVNSKFAPDDDGALFAPRQPERDWPAEDPLDEQRRRSFSAEDVKYLAYSQLALRHIEGQGHLDRHLAGPKDGDAHCIGAVHLLLTPEEKEESKKPAHGYIDVVEKYADKLARRLDDKLDDIIRDSHVTLDGKVQPGHFFMLMRDMDGVDLPYDLDAYPMGKAGRQEIKTGQIAAVVEANTHYGVSVIADEIKRTIRQDNVNGILNVLYLEAQNIMDGNAPEELQQQDIQRFAKNMDVLRKVDPEAAYGYAMALLINPQSEKLHDVAESAAVSSISALAKTDPESATIRANVAVELGPRSELQTRLADAVRPFSSSAKESKGDDYGRSSSPPVSLARKSPGAKLS